MGLYGSFSLLFFIPYSPMHGASMPPVCAFSRHYSLRANSRARGLGLVGRRLQKPQTPSPRACSRATSIIIYCTIFPILQQMPFRAGVGAVVNFLLSVNLPTPSYVTQAPNEQTSDKRHAGKHMTTT